jgi:putative FmdB family regulatory protein
MPTYEYRCNVCSQRFSQFYRSMAIAQGAACPPCPACGALDTARAMSTFAAQTGAGASASDSESGSHTRSPAQATPREQIDRWRAGKARD